ncbi:MAG: GIY-YIG nuclease family protein [Bacteroidetes bacterium]|nr:GIY-YIG nuclease family protein [Bacteroidota bacterium]
MGHFVYIIYSETKDIYYKGETSEVNQRLHQHNNNLSRFTADKGPWKLVFIEEFETRSEALKKEKQIKRLNRKSIEKIINSNFNKL